MFNITSFAALKISTYNIRNFDAKKNPTNKKELAKVLKNLDFELLKKIDLELVKEHNSRIRNKTEYLDFWLLMDFVESLAYIEPYLENAESTFEQQDSISWDDGGFSIASGGDWFY